MKPLLLLALLTTVVVVSLPRSSAAGDATAPREAPAWIEAPSDAKAYQLKDGVFLHEVFGGESHYYLIQDTVEHYQLTPKGLSFGWRGFSAETPRRPADSVVCVISFEDSTLPAEVTRGLVDSERIQQIIRRCSPVTTVKDIFDMRK